MNNEITSKQIRIYGAGGHAIVVTEVLLLNGFEISKIFDDNLETNDSYNSEITHGARVNLNQFPHNGPPIIIAIGNNLIRSEIAKMLSSEFGQAFHSSAVIGRNVILDEGTVVFAGAVIQPNTKIGKHVIINTCASVDHDNIIGDFVHISPNATLCGNVEIMEGTQIGSAAVVIPNVKVGKWCVIGAGTVVLSDIPDYCTVVGNPGRIIKRRLNTLKK